jgi:phosphoenolpyruvate synthase/pyruvate phosphate dikinase
VSYIFPLDGCEPHLAEVVGGKAVGLASLLRESLRVPPGFGVGTHAYREFVSETGLNRAIHELLDDAESLEAQAEASKRIRLLFEERELAGPLRDELARTYEGLGGDGQLPVAVRSSAISEDNAEASFAGEHETYLWIQGADAVARAVVRCWASLFTPQALSYFRRVDLRADETTMGVVVQAMVAAEAAGVMFTIDPVTGDRSQIAIEGSFGLGEAVVAGEVTPDRYAVDKVTLEIRSRALSAKHVAYRFDTEHGEMRLVDIPDEQQRLACLSDEEAVEVASLGKRVERALGAPQDIEWAIGPGTSGTREVFLLQTRPETVWSRKQTKPPVAAGSTPLERLAHARTKQQSGPA